MPTNKSSVPTLAQIAQQAEELSNATQHLPTAAGDYADAQRLWEALSLLHGMRAVLRVRRAALWVQDSEARSEQRRQERRASREAARLAELEADRIASRYSKA